MNILISALSLQIGGGEVLAMALASRLAKNHNVVFFYHWDHRCNRDLGKKLLSEQVTVLSPRSFLLINFFAWKLNALMIRIHPKLLFHDFVKSLFLRYVIRKYKIDVVNSHSKFSDSICLKAIKGSHVPLVITEHGEYAQLIKNNDFSCCDVLSKAKKVVAVSDYNKSLLIESGIKSSMVERIYNACVLPIDVDCDSLKIQLGIPQDAFVFGMVARGIKEKGWLQAIEAFCRVRNETDRKLALVLVGEGDDLSSLKKKYLSDRCIYFPGATSDPSAFIRLFDVGLLPSYFKGESFPLTLIDCLYFNKPIIATNIGGIKELICINGRELGCLISIDKSGCADIDMLYSEMLRYVLDDKHYMYHVEGIIASKEQFDINRLTENYIKVFSDSINGNF